MKAAPVSDIKMEVFHAHFDGRMLAKPMNYFDQYFGTKLLPSHSLGTIKNIGAY